MLLLTDEQFLPVAVNLIKSARDSIDISTFKAEISNKPRGKRLVTLFDTVIKQARLGLPVRFLLNAPEMTGHIPLSNLYAIRELKKNKIEMRSLPNGRICHAKIIIIDKVRAIIGSHNLSIRSCHYNFEMSIYIEKSDLLSCISHFFDRTYKNAKKL